MNEFHTCEAKYEKGFDKNIEGDGIKYRTVCRKYHQWIVNGRIINPSDSAEPKPQPIQWDRRSLLLLGVT